MKKGSHKLEKNYRNSLAPEEEVLPTTINYLTSFMIEEARLELKETDETREKALTELRKKIAAEPKLYSRTDDLFLLAFLRSRKFNVKRAFQLLQKFWSFRKEYKNIYEDVEYERTMSIIMQNYFGYLPYRDRNGCQVFVAKLGEWNPEVVAYESLFRSVSTALYFALEYEATHIAGFRIILDFRGVHWKQLKCMTPANLLTATRSTQFCFPARYKGVHVISENKMLNFFWMMISPLLSSKLRKRIFFHGEDLTPLLRYIDPSVLPEELGGKAPPFDNSEWMGDVEKRIEAIKTVLEYGYKD